MQCSTIAVCLVSLVGVSRAAEPAATGLPPSGSEQSATESELTFSLLGAYGAGGRYQDSAINRYGPGVGARGGITLAAPQLYLGGSFVHFVGGKGDSGEFHTSTLDTELGYDVRLMQGLLVVRPQLALGLAQVVTIQSDNAGYPLAFHWAPGLLLGLRWSPLFASVELRRDLVPGEWSDATSIALGVGVSL